MEKEKMLSTQQVADRLDRPYPTIALWVRQGRFKNAVAEETARGRIWWIPESDLTGFAEPKPGRPSKIATTGSTVTDDQAEASAVIEAAAKQAGEKATAKASKR